MLIQYSSQQSPGRLREGEIIYFSCEEGYRLRGASSAKCLSTGDFERSAFLHTVKVTILNSHLHLKRVNITEEIGKHHS